MILKTLFFFLCLLLPCCKCKVAVIRTTQPLNFSESLLSKDNNFELHFFNPGTNASNNWYLGVRYAKLPDKPVVWVANRDDPIIDTSGVSLVIDRSGNLALFLIDNMDTPIWSTNISVHSRVDDPGTISAQLLDSGNLILINNDDEENPLWQSFDYPTDTYLPGMKVGMNRRTGLRWSATSWKSEDDPGTGEYSARIDLSGVPQFILDKGLARIWRGSPWPWTKHPSKLAVYPIEFTYEENDEATYYVFYPNDRLKMARIVMERSGKLKVLMWNMSGQSQWDEYWTAPEGWCDSYAVCGANSICSNDRYSRFQCDCLPGFCDCLPGFKPREEGEWRQRNASSGCLRIRVEEQAMRCESGDEFVVVERVNLPDTSAATLIWVGNNEECGAACKQNCSCTAFMSYGSDRGKSGCFMWFGELVDIFLFTDEGNDLNVRVNTIPIVAGNLSKSKSVLGRKRILAVVVISIGLPLLISLGFLLFWLKRKQKTSCENEETRPKPDLPFFHLSTIMAATDNFSLENKLGQGGFGSVYQGLLPDGQQIAVKRLSKTSGQGVEEFKNETVLIAKLQHRNLVKLLGFCVDGEEKMLIYEYMANKSLDSFVFNQTRRSCLDWKKRFDIIIGIARGVLYLHQDSRLRIIHRDLKASNVLLDSKMNPKISDFGMARMFTGDQTQDKTNRVVGTYGYMSPEYAVFGKFSTKSDVFSFGVIMLEIISGKRNNQCCQDNNSINLIGYVWQVWKEDRALEIVDSLLELYIPNEALRCIQIGLLCVQQEVDDRPTMSEVVLMLSSEIVLPPPNKPAYMFTTNLEDTDLQVGERKLCSINHLTISKVIAR